MSWYRICCTFPLVIALYSIPHMLEAQETAPRREPLTYESIAASIVDSALVNGRAYTMLAELTGAIGPRLSGSSGAEAAVAWGERTMKAQGLENVRRQRVMVPHWVRGEAEEAYLIEGKGERRLNICALGGSVATPEGGVAGDVVEVRRFDEAEKIGDAAKGKILFFNEPMERGLVSTFEAYGRAVDQRVDGAVVGGKMGAAAVLVRSVTTSVDSVPHTGVMYYKEGIPRIPAAAISTVDAEYLGGLIASGKGARVRLRLDCAMLPDAESANVIGELIGMEKPEEVVVIGAHLDSWDVCEGAHDDGAGCVQVIEAIRILKSLGLRPRRTIRAVLYMNEENGLRGGRGYAEEIAAAGERHIAAIESDRGGFAPRGFTVDGDDTTVAKLARWAHLFDEIGASAFTRGGGGADIGPLKPHGAVPIGLLVESHRYFDYHHSAKDTFDKVNERELALGAAAIAILAYVLAMEGM